MLSPGEEPVKVRIRGIYATALTKLMLDKGFDVVQPSPVIAERFSLEPSGEEPDVIISDRADKHGIVLSGPGEPVEQVLSVLREELPDAIFRRAPFELWAIYRGIVVDHARRIVSIGGVVGQLADGEELDPEDVEVLVQVVRYEGKKPILTRFVRLRGRFAILKPFEPGIEHSRKIKDEEKVSWLEELGREIAPEGMGLRWRSRAVLAREEELRSDVEGLLAYWEELSRAFASSDEPCKLAPGKALVDVEFPLSAKERLDELRASVCPTLRDHHALKACGGSLSNSVEMAERLLSQGMPEEQVRGLFEEVLKREMPCEGSRLTILHVKLDGTVIRLGEACVLEASDDLRRLLLVRRIRGRGLYDGLGTVREPGDVALTRTGLGSMRLITSYMGPDGAYKGTYVNINTPVEVCSERIRYVDLEVDVCIWPDGRVKVLDEDELYEAVERGVISAQLAERVMAEAEAVIRDVGEGLIGPPKPRELELLGLEGQDSQL